MSLWAEIWPADGSSEAPELKYSVLLLQLRHNLNINFVII